MIKNYGSKWLNLVDEESELYNRLYPIHYLNETFSRPIRSGTPLSCLLIKKNSREEAYISCRAGNNPSRPFRFWPVFFSAT